MQHPPAPSEGPDSSTNHPATGQPAGFGVIDRRVWPVDRRRIGADGSPAADAPSGLERRRGPGRRLSDFTRSAEEGQLTKEQFLFLMAIEQFKKANAKTFPTWTDVLEVVRLLGYRKTCSSELTIGAAEDWRETAEAPHGVRAARWAQRRAVDEKRRSDRAA